MRKVVAIASSFIAMAGAVGFVFASISFLGSHEFGHAVGSVIIGLGTAVCSANVMLDELGL